MLLLITKSTFLALIWMLVMAGCQVSEAAPTPAPVPPQAQTGGAFYVATGGDDANPGTEALPWRTLQHAAQNVGPGDTVLVRGGVYAEAVTIAVSGSETGGYVTFKSYPGETAVIDGGGLTVPADGGALINIDSQSYVIVQGFELRNYVTDDPDRVPMGVYVSGDAHHIQLLDNHIHRIENNGGKDGNAHGIAVYGTEAPAAIHDLLIRGNELHDLKLGNSEALVLNGNVHAFTVTRNRVHDNDNIGIDIIGFEETAPDPVYDQARDGVVSENEVYNIDTVTNPAYGGEQSAAAIYVDGGARVVIERNRVYGSNFGIEIASEHKGRATSHVTVRNNLIYRNHIAGLAMGGYDRQRGSTENCAIVNNTFFQNDVKQDGNGELYIQFDTRDNLIANNIFVANEQSLFMTNAYTENSGNRVDYNLYFAPAGVDDSEWQWRDVAYQGLSAYQAGTGNDAHSFFADPRFADAAGGDFHLLAGSPAIDQGENLAESDEVDFDGGPRLQNGRTDLGALEYASMPAGDEAMRPFPQHVTYAAGTIRPNRRSQEQQDDDVRAAYDHWKASYLKAAGTDDQGRPLYRVSFGSSDPGRTVSEGQGYGMIIVALMAGYDADAHTLFDGLWRFTRAHPSTIDSRLMAWEVPEDPASGADSAFDGDADMAYGLLLAAAQWGNDGDIDYAAAATQLITAIRESTIGPQSYLPELGDWVDPDGVQYSQYSPRSSDFMSAHFRAYGRFTGDPAWTQVLAATQSTIDFMQATYSPSTGLLPDFMVPASASDHTLRPAPPNHLEGPNDGAYGYNAGRDPWRMATDALINGDPVSLAQTRRLANWIATATEGDPAKIRAGYQLDGTPLPGINYFTTFFAAPFGAALMTTPEHQAFLNDLYDSVYSRREDYYEDSVTLLTLLLMTGNYWDPTVGDDLGFRTFLPAVRSD